MTGRYKRLLAKIIGGLTLASPLRLPPQAKYYLVNKFRASTIATALFGFSLSLPLMGEWAALSYSTRFTSGSVESACRAAIAHHSALYLKNKPFSTCPVRDEFYSVDPDERYDTRKRCVAERIIGPCPSRPNVYKHKWHLSAYYQGNISNNGHGCNNTSNPINIPTGNKYYEVLESTKEDSLDTIKKRYRKLVKEYHYDSIASKDLPQEMVDFAEQKTKDLNEAYSIIKKARN